MNSVRTSGTVLVILCAVFMWFSGLYAGLHWHNKIKLKPDVETNSLSNISTNHVFEANRTTRLSCPTSIAVAWDVGRFGNKFFEYLTARLTAQVLGNEMYITQAFAGVYDQYFIGRKTPIIDWNYLNNKCGIAQSNCTQLKLNYLKEFKPVSNQTFQCIKFDGYPVDATTSQWEVIFSKRNELIKEFQWKPDLKNLTDKTLENIRANQSTSIVVAVHARRTDYSVYLVPYYGSFRPANASYYMKAMDYFKKKYVKPAFLIFSDDMKWCKENLVGPDIVYSGNGNQNDPGQDLALISSCDHIILSYGTFGIAAAWFNNHGEIISADNFTGKPERMVEALKKVPSLKWNWMSV